MPTAEYVTVDVFTSERFSGNPLAVVPDARGISDETMQKIAAEFGYSETTFVLPPEDPENSARVRIFTPTVEVPFAGHPNVGTAYVLGQRPELFGTPVGDRLRFEELAGLVEVELLREESRVTGATIRAPRPLDVGDEVTPDLVARCASIEPAMVLTQTHAPIFTSVGLPFALAEIDGLEALGAACPDLSAFREAAGRHQVTDFSLFLYVRLEPWRVRARMFAPLDNVMEDPATGSASAALAAYLATLAEEADLDTHITVEQGVEMGRASVIELDVRKQGGIVRDVSISGRCVSAMRGAIDW